MDDGGDFRQRSMEAKAEGEPHLSEVVQLSWHKGPVAGDLGLVSAGGEAEKGGRRQIM